MSRSVITANCARGSLFFAILLVTSRFAHGQTGPVGWWKFDEGSGTTTADSSGNGGTGTLVNSPPWTAGRVGPGALVFNGTNANVNIPNASGVLDNLQNTTMTVAAWIKPTGTGGGSAGRIVEKGGWFFSVASSGSSTVVKLTCQDTAGNRVSGPVTLNTWTHVAATWDGGASGAGMHLFINGVPSDGAFAAGSGSVGTDVGSMSVGNRSADLARGFPGTIDSVQIYNRTLSAAEISALADSTPPNPPTSLTASASSSNQINLGWAAPTDNIGVTGYMLERCQGAGCTTSFAQIATPSSPSFADTGRSASTSYGYRVRATDANSNLSSYSAIASATTPAGGVDATPPSPPSGLIAVSATSTQVSLSWTGSNDNVGVTAYLLERCKGEACTGFAQIGAPSTPAYSDVGLMANTPYSYRVLAEDAANNKSPYSSTLSIITPVGTGTCHP